MLQDEEESIDPYDKEYEETLKNAKRKLERPMALAMPCKRMVHPSITKVMAKPKIGDEQRSKTNPRGISTIQKPQVKDSLRCLIAFWCTSLFRCHKQ